MAGEREMRNERRMSDVEALMWNLEKDPYLASSFANVTLLDQPPDPDRLRARLAHAVSVVPRLRHRVAPALGRLAPPEWQDDPNFDLDYHIRHVALPPPGSLEQLSDLVGRLMSRPLDHGRPLWELYLIEGIEDDRGAVFVKSHHAAVDGVAAVGLVGALCDLSEDAPPPPPPDTPC